MSHNNVLYKISYKNCEVTYIEQTKRRLRIQINKHRSNSKKSSVVLSVSNHRTEFNYDYNWKEIKILDEKYKAVFQDRLLLKMLYIKKQSYAVNKKSDIELISDDYLSIHNM